MPLPLVALLHAVAFGQAQPTCQEVLDHQVCGYHCRFDSGGNVACAQTEAGVCTAETGRAYCWDPSQALAAIWSGPLPQAECKVRYSRVACGYDCKAGLGAVACAKTPFGICRSLYGRVVCWDPSLPLIYAAQGDLSPPECREDDGAIACGYHCKAGLHGVRCAATPDGFCHRELGTVACWDPELPPIPPMP